MLKRSYLFLAVMVVVALVACQPQTVEVTRVVTETEEVEVVVTEVVEIAGEQVEVTRVIVEEVEVVVEPTAVPVPQGGNVVESTFADISHMQPVQSADQSSNDVINLMFLSLVDLEPFTARVIGEIAENWDVSEDGLIYTFHLRDDIFWSDGTALTANDVAFTMDAIFTDSVASPIRGSLGLVDSWQALDDSTFELTMKSLDCTVLASGMTFGVLPAHVYGNDPENVPDNPENSAPSVVSGPFTFVEWVPDDHVTLAANPDFYLGKPNLDTWTYKVYADQSAELAGFLAGEVDKFSQGTGPQFVSVVDGQIAAGQPMEMRKWFEDGNDFIALNLANPANPQNGWQDLDGDGKFTEGEPPQEQDPHPILSDLAVRQAIAYSVDYTGIINKVAFGQAFPTLANTWPSIEWAYNSDVEPYAQDLELAQSILDDAGWVDSDGDGVRERDGQPLSFSLMTNAGNELRENIGILTKDVLDSIGFDVQLDFVEFGTVVQKLLGQEFDAVIIGFGDGPPDPDDSTQFSYQADEVGAGFNMVSYYSEQVETNLAEGKAVPGCSESERAPFYKENQELMHNDIPYVWLFSELDNAIWWNRLKEVDPNPWNGWYNIHDWYLQP